MDELVVMKKKTWELVTDDNYFRDILTNIAHCVGSHKLAKEISVCVRFGNRGDGVHPNYQIEWPSGIRRFAGSNHELFHDNPHETFEESNLEEDRFSYAGIQELIDKASKAKKGLPLA